MQNDANQKQQNQTTTEEAFRKWEAQWIDRWDGIEPFPDRLAIFRAGWERGRAAERDVDTRVFDAFVRESENQP